MSGAVAVWQCGFGYECLNVWLDGWRCGWLMLACSAACVRLRGSWPDWLATHHAPCCPPAVDYRKLATEMFGQVEEEPEEGEDEELGVRIHATYPESLEREGFVGSSTAYNLPSSPEFELKTVSGSGSNGPAAGAPASAASLSRR